MNDTPVSNWLKATDFRMNRCWVFRENVLLTEVNGKWLTAKEFDKKYPVPKPLHFRSAPENPDKRNEYLK
jgi:hypothetical protein